MGPSEVAYAVCNLVTGEREVINCANTPDVNTAVLFGNNDGRDNMIVNCEQGLVGGGWEPIITLKTKDTPAMTWGNNFWTTSDLMGSSANIYTSHWKSTGFTIARNFSQIMIHVHNNGAMIGTAVYEVLPENKEFSLLETMQKKEDVIYTGPRVSKTGGIKSQLILNPERGQSLYGDIFVDEFDQPLVINKKSGWAAGINYNRIATTLTNNDYSHTFAGIGGHHENGVGSWLTHYEYAPISSYCNFVRGYGNDNNYAGYPGQAWSNSGCRASNYGWVNADVSVHIKF